MMDPQIPEIEDVPSILLPCASCGRTFRPEALSKHSKVCEKSLMKKRKQFDSSKQRLQGTEIENFATPPVTKGPKKRESLGNAYKPKVKEKVDVSRTIQAVKKTVEPSSAVHVKPSDHEECPHCGRSFGPKAFERHTEFCKEQHQKLKLTPTINNEAKERLKVRTSYRGPLTNKVLTRDKYNPNRNRDPSPMTVSAIELRDESHKTKGITRNSSLRSSLRSRSSEVTPPPPLRRTMTQINPPRSTRASRESVNDIDDSSFHSASSQRNSETSRPRLYSKETAERKDAEKYNPYLSAERQMLELFGGDESKPKTQTLPEIPCTSPIQSSPTSAFVKYSTPRRSSSIENLKSDNKENNNDNSNLLEAISPNLEEKIDNHRNFSLSNLSLCSVVSIESIDSNKNLVNSKLANSRLEDFQRSFSALESKPNRTYSKTKVNMQQMLYGTQSPEPTAQSESSNSDTGNLEACEAELLISMLEFEKMLKSSPLPSLETSPTLCSSGLTNNNSKISEDNAENQKNQRNVNQSVDSAYSSLTRSIGADGDGGGPADLPKFCHECGSKYPVVAAKFCCNCGVKRITI